MKKLINFTVILTMLFTVLVTAPSVNAEELPPYDYSSFVGEWHKIDPDGLNGDVLLKILNVTDNGEIRFSIDNGDVVSGVIQDNQVKWTEQWYDGSMGLTLTFYDDHIHLQYSRYSEEWYTEIVFVSDSVKPRRIEAGEYSVVLNDEKLEFDQPPVMCGDRILVPLRKILETLNADVYYDDDSDTGFDNDYDWYAISAVKNDTIMRIEKSYSSWYFRKANLYDKNFDKYSDIHIDVNPIVLNGRTLVPVRVLTEYFGADVSWDENSNTVFINADTTGQRKSAEEMAKADAFTGAVAHKMAEDAGIGAGGDVHAPDFDETGKFFEFPVFDNHGEDDGIVKLYYNGRIEHYRSGQCEIIRMSD